MSRIVYVNGEYLPEEDAKISVFDRGFLFADGVYEVSSVLDGKLVDNAAHLVRLARSLGELRMESPLPPAEIEAVQNEMIARNNLVEGALYLQVSRGAADRDFSIPKDAKPSLVMFTQAKKLADNPAAQKGWSVILVEDIRWKRRDIKTVQLLAPSLAKQAALDAGADDAWMVEGGFVTEGTSNNAWIVKGGKLITRHLSPEILHGITRRAVMRACRRGRPCGGGARLHPAGSHGSRRGLRHQRHLLRDAGGADRRQACRQWQSRQRDGAAAPTLHRGSTPRISRLRAAFGRIAGAPDN